MPEGAVRRMYEVDEIRTDERFLEIFSLLAHWPPSEGKEVALTALALRSPHTLVAWDEGYSMVGVATYRTNFLRGEQGYPIKRINMGVEEPCQGVGTALVRKIAELTGFQGQWTKSRPEAWGWCEALGMRDDSLLDDGRKIFVWGSDKVREWYNDL